MATFTEFRTGATAWKKAVELWISLDKGLTAFRKRIDGVLKDLSDEIRQQNLKNVEAQRAVVSARALFMLNHPFEWFDNGTEHPDLTGLRKLQTELAMKPGPEFKIPLALVDSAFSGMFEVTQQYQTLSSSIELNVENWGALITKYITPLEGTLRTSDDIEVRAIWDEVTDLKTEIEATLKQVWDSAEISGKLAGLYLKMAAVLKKLPETALT